MCTWVDCGKEAVHKEIDKQGKPWAELCDVHHDMLEDCFKSGDARLVLSYWVKAQGGSKGATERMKPAIEAGTKLFAALNGFKSTK